MGWFSCYSWTACLQCPRTLSFIWLCWTELLIKGSLHSNTKKTPHQITCNTEICTQLWKPSDFSSETTFSLELILSTFVWHFSLLMSATISHAWDIKVNSKAAIQSCFIWEAKSSTTALVLQTKERFENTIRMSPSSCSICFWHFKMQTHTFCARAETACQLRLPQINRPSWFISTLWSKNPWK